MSSLPSRRTNYGSARADWEPLVVVPDTNDGAAHNEHDNDDDGDDDHPYRFGVFHLSERLSDGFVPLYRTFSEGVQSLAHPSFVLSERARDPEQDRRKHFRAAGTSSILSEVANLSKNTIGGGVMSLSGGIALYANNPQAVLSAAAWLVGLGFLFGYFCLLYVASVCVFVPATLDCTGSLFLLNRLFPLVYVLIAAATAAAIGTTILLERARRVKCRSPPRTVNAGNAT
jgi:hypothetical protein